MRNFISLVLVLSGSILFAQEATTTPGASFFSNNQGSNVQKIGSKKQSVKFEAILCKQLYNGTWDNNKCWDHDYKEKSVDNLAQFFQLEETKNMGTEWFKTIAASQLSSAINPQNVNAPLSPNSDKKPTTNLLTEDIQGIWTGMNQLQSEKKGTQNRMNAVKSDFNDRIFPLYRKSGQKLTIRTDRDPNINLLIHLKALQQLIPSCIKYFHQNKDEKKRSSNFQFITVQKSQKTPLPFICDPTQPNASNGFKEFWKNINKTTVKIREFHIPPSNNTNWNQSFKIRLEQLSSDIKRLNNIVTHTNDKKPSQEEWKEELTQIKEQANILIDFVQPVVLKKLDKKTTNTQHLEISNLLGTSSYFTPSKIETNIQAAIRKCPKGGSFRLSAINTNTKNSKINQKQKNLQDLSSYLQAPDFFLNEIPFDHEQPAVLISGMPFIFNSDNEAKWDGKHIVKPLPGGQHNAPLSEIQNYRASLAPSILDMRNNYQSKTNSFLALKTFSMGLLYELGMRRATQYVYTYECGTDNTSTITSTPEEVDEYNATFRMNSEWREQIAKESSEVELMKEMVLLLAEQRAEQFKEYNQNERIIGSMALSQLQALEPSIDALKQKNKKINTMIESYLNGQEGKTA